MPFLELPKRFNPDFAVPTKKPVGEVELDRSNPLAPGKYAYLPGSQIEPLNLARPNEGNALRVGTNPLVKTANARGQLVDFQNGATASSAQAMLRLPTFGLVPSGYVFAEFSTDTLSSNDYIFSNANSVSPNDGRVYIVRAGSGINVRLANGATHSSTASISLGEIVRVLMTWEGGNAELYINGVLDSTFTYTGTVGTTVANTTHIGGYQRITNFFDPLDGQVSMLYADERHLTEREALSLIRNPYQVLKPKTLPTYFIPAAAGGGVTVDVPVGALTLTGQVPTIDATDDKAVEIPLGALDLTGLVPTIQAGAAVDVEIPAGALNLAGFAPVIQTGDNVTVDIPTGALSLTGFIPTVVAPNAVSVPLGALLLTGFAPTVIAGIGVEIPLGALNLSGFAPNIDLTDNLTVSIPLGALTLTGFAPVADIGDLAIEIPLGSLNLTGFIPTILAQGIIWTVQPDAATNWTEQTDESTTWTIQ